jgi:ABC-2 type transport system ATP-binding protein
VISAKNLTKFYGEKCAIKDVSFSVDKGEILGFLGPNAAGKTTTMRILTGYFPPTSGTAEVAGYDILEDSLEVRRRVGYLPENFPLYKDMTVAEFLDFVAAIKRVPGDKRKAAIDDAMEKCGLAHEAGNFIGRLSKGYCQRVGIAQAIINDPDVLILDEPTVGLDPNQIVEIRALIKSLAGKSTVILSSHILYEISMICNKVIIIHNGEILTIDTPDNLSSSLQKTGKIYLEVEGDKDRLTQFLSEMEGIKVLDSLAPVRSGIWGVNIETASLDHTIKKTLAASLVKADFGLFELHSKVLTLEDIFIKMTEKGGAQN